MLCGLYAPGSLPAECCKQSWAAGLWTHLVLPDAAKQAAGGSTTMVMVMVIVMVMVVVMV